MLFLHLVLVLGHPQWHNDSWVTLLDLGTQSLNSSATYSFLAF